MRMLLRHTLLFVAALTVAGVSLAHARERSSVEARYQWDLTALYPSDAAWKQAKDDLAKRIPAFAGVSHATRVPDLSVLSTPSASIGVTVSVGAARYSAGESQESWIERVDRAMYQAKQSGRNRIVMD